MRTRILSNLSALLVLIWLGLPNYASAQSGTLTITQWNFNTIGVVSPPYNNPPPTLGVGTAAPLGMTNNYPLATGVGSIANCDVTAGKQPARTHGC